MPLLGKAIARHLKNLRGLYSVELPTWLKTEMVDIVLGCNEGNPKRALLVTDMPVTELSNENITAWAELLKWRTNDDRVFVWERSYKEPDTSFQSVVKPFISARFPGEPRGECSLNLLAEISIKELWLQNQLKIIGDTYDSFLDTTKWVAGILRYSFERVGSTPSAHWSDQFLIHWSETFNLLNDGIASSLSQGINLQPRHAWEIVRVAGLLVPREAVKESKNIFLSRPEAIQEKDWQGIARRWQELVDEQILTEENRAVLLMALDDVVKGNDKTSSWRSLCWEALKNISIQDLASAPSVGQKVFVCDSSPTLLTNEVPTYPVSPKPAWWGATETDIQEALEKLQKTTYFRPSPNCTILKSIPGQPNSYWLLIRNGDISLAQARGNWKADVTIRDLEMVFKAPWAKLVVSATQPSEKTRHTWIDPSDISMTFSGREIKTKVTQVSISGPHLTVKFDLTINYSAKIDNSGEINGKKWNPIRAFQIKAKVRDYDRETATYNLRNVDSTIKVFTPSPYNLTILVIPEEKGKLTIIPGSGDIYASSSSLGNTWAAETTPDIVLREDGDNRIEIYDGRVDPVSPSFSPSLVPTFNWSPITQVDPDSGLYFGEYHLDDGDVIGASNNEIAVVKVRERSGNLSSGLLSVIRGLPAGKRPPSNNAKASLPGRYQVQIAKALSTPPTSGFNSLYQFVVSTGEELSSWPDHPGTPSPLFLFNRQESFILPGIENGPSSSLVETRAWADFMQAIADVCNKAGLKPGGEQTWITGIDPSVIPAKSIRNYIHAHVELIRAAKNISMADTFWASYPFSIMIVEGKGGANFGHLLALLLSPLHPVRLAWAYTVAFIAKNSKSKGKGGSRLAGLAEGWNFPLTGNTVSVSGQKLRMVAVPIDPGEEQDFATWSALAVLGVDGLASLPPAAMGLPLPWGGQTGINRKVITQAIRDYLSVHPHINTLELEIRSVSSAPRSREIDDAVLELIGGEKSLDEVDSLGGGTRVQDSANRLGQGPTRDNFFLVREDGQHNRPFEWRRYQPKDIPISADIAFIENSSVNLDIAEGDTSGIICLLPQRRFLPAYLKDQILEQNYSAIHDDDLLGLASLLNEIEFKFNDKNSTLQAIPQAHALGVGLGARWEILGTFNIDPKLLSSIVAKQSESKDKRLLWEWRPSWLGYGQSEVDIAKRPYYVVGKIPASLLKALEYRHGFTNQQAFEVLRELGRRGIGLTSLHAAGGTQESAALGFFFALRLLLPEVGLGFRTKWAFTEDSSAVFGVIPVDPIETILEELAGKALERRADLLAVFITRDTKTKICLVPIEIKHHGRESEPSPFPDNSNSELKRARDQLEKTSKTLKQIFEGIGEESNNDIVGCYTKLTGLAVLLELAMSLATVAPSSTIQSEVIRDVLNGHFSMTVCDGVLLWFAPGSISTSGQACIINPNGITKIEDSTIHEVFIDPAAVRGLWWKNTLSGLNEEYTRQQFDDVMSFAFSSCGETGTEFDLDIRRKLAILLYGDIEEEINHFVKGGNGESMAPPVEEFPLPAETPSMEEAKTDNIEQKPGEDHPSSRESEIQHLDESRKHGIPDSSIGLEQKEPPRAFFGWSAPTSRWSYIGKLVGTNESVGMDYDHPKAMGIFGYMGSGKSYLLGTLVESALQPIPKINNLSAPLAVVIFNYRRNASDRFELSSLAWPNQNENEVNSLAEEYGAFPQPVKDIHILSLPGELTEARLVEYGHLPSSELLFNPSTLTIEDWELLMGEPGSNAVFARTIRHALRELRSNVTLEGLEDYVLDLLKGQSRTAAELRFEFIRQYISEEKGTSFHNLLKPGRAVILDLRQPLFNRDDALRFFLICSNYVSRVQGKFNKLVVFDEAHEYLSDEFGEKLDARIRLMRHEGTSYIFATQDVGSIPSTIRRFLTTRFVFGLGTRENVDDLLKIAPEFEGHDLLHMNSGVCLIQSNDSIQGVFRRPRLVKVRPRVTQHGGTSRIFSPGLPS